MSASRAAVSTCAVAICISLLALVVGGAPGSVAAQTLAPAAATTTTAPPLTLVPPTTLPALPTTTAPPASTPTTKPTAPTTTTTPTPGTGVPSVPVGGPPTTVAKKGKKPPAPPAVDVDPILAAVQSNLDQLTAIAEFSRAQTAVARAQAQVTKTGAALQGARAVLTRAQAGQAAAATVVGKANGEMRAMAIAAYVGVGYANPTTSAGNSSAGSTSLGALTGIEAIDAKEMLILVGQQARKGVADAHHQAFLAAKVTQRAQAGVNRAQTKVVAAEAVLLSSQDNLKLVTEAATTPGAAATLALPGSSGPRLAGAVDAAVSLPAPRSPTILGPSVLTGAELAAWFATTGRKANTTVSIQKLAADYQAAGKTTGVRYDLAFAQSLIETGFFSFPSYGQLTSKDNNFAGIGACDSCAHGWSFPNAQTGVGAQLELLEAYASPKKIATPLVGPVGVGGCCPTWIALAGKWASSLVYGVSIMTIYNQMLTWVIPQRLVKAGLLSPKSPQAKGPLLAPLAPGTPKQAPAANHVTAASLRHPG